MAQNNVLIKRDSSWRKIYEVLATRMKKLITAHARKNKRTALMLANARKGHSIPLLDRFFLKDDDVRNGRKAKVCHGRLRAAQESMSKQITKKEQKINTYILLDVVV